MNVKILIILGLALIVAVSPVYAKEKYTVKQLPSGLAKKLKSGKSLPPGWEKKIAPGKILGKDIYAHGKILVPLDPSGVVTIKIDNKVLRVHEESRKIIKIFTH